MRLAHEPVAVVGMVTDLAVEDAARLPDVSQRQTRIEGISLPRLAVAQGAEALPALLALIKSLEDNWI